MKKMVVGLLLVVFLFTGCAGFNAGTGINIGTEAALSVYLINHPDQKVGVKAALVAIKAAVANPITYDQLLLEVAKRLGPNYAYVALIVTEYFQTDAPILPGLLSDKYREDIIKRIDRFILIASI